VTAALQPPQHLREAFRRPRRRIFRLETRQSYNAPDEAGQLAAFRAGRRRPPDPGKDEWTAVIRAGVTTGTRFERVHVCREPLSEYLRYELTWSYQPSVAAGEHVRIVPLPAGQPWPAELPQLDFWLFDDAELVVMRYDPDGRWLGVESACDRAPLAQAVAWRQAALRRSVGWNDYVTARPELAARLVPQWRAS
jgi:hypothetical protein